MVLPLVIITIFNFGHEHFRLTWFSQIISDVSEISVKWDEENYTDYFDTKLVSSFTYN